MSIIFQLFRSDYLDQLGENALNTLKQTVRQYFKVNEFVDTTRNTTLKTSPLIDQMVVDQAVANIQERARMVFQQLHPQPPPPNVLPGRFNLSQPLYPQLFDAGDLNRLTPHQRDILEMAISCEVTHFNGYVHLLEVREQVDKTVIPRPLGPGILPPAPDTLYSPFNPGSPLYTLYNPPPP
jgi:hypothetical protein